MVREGGKSRLTVHPQAVQIKSDAFSQAEVALSLGIAPEIKFAADSPLEEDGFELVVPLSKRTAVPGSPIRFPGRRHRLRAF